MPLKSSNRKETKSCNSSLPSSASSSSEGRMTFCPSIVSPVLEEDFGHFERAGGLTLVPSSLPSVFSLLCVCRPQVPVKHEHVVFCKMSNFQLDLYRLFIRSPEIKKLLRGSGSQPLKAIGILKKLCNHPDLLDLPSDLEGSEELFPEGYVPRDRRNVNPELSGKMMVLQRFLETIRATTNDKIVLISNYTQTLDVFERMCRANRWGNFRLDGTMTVSKRQKLVDKFNDPEGKEFIFLLSSKAGGCGLNLIGANRLVLFDPDWNPASDQQALARVWRDGQKKSCKCKEKG
ncbi:hypothetical protein IE53DRAFT_15877 [Violaceomyces palustris]|uniref:Uncharacterized protein n=1 Tax=Violaceomyces palustris TaxID=1673888 RepID=A0ACD0NLJ3_9BASI|nr:hypothetical protein IE53DRAFT_15877 [Violaceomyces palustris]